MARLPDVDRGQRLLTFGFIALIAAIFIAALFSCTSDGQLGHFSAKRTIRAELAGAPNIVVVILDDANEAQTLTRLSKTKQRLTALGVNILTFSNAYCSTPLCAASRATLLTGKYARETGVHFNDAINGGAPAFVAGGTDQDTIATRLSASGYDAALVGKYMNAYDSIVPPIGPPGFGYARAMYSPNDGYFGYSMATQSGSISSKGHAEADYSTDVWLSRSLTVVQQATAAPFLLWLALSTPHEPAIPAPRHATLYSSQAAPRTPAYANAADKIGKPDWFQGLDWTAAEEADDDAFYRNQLRTLASADEAIVAIVDAVVAAGKIDSTLFVVLSDNGYSHGEHFWAGKGYPYQPAVKTPFVFAAKAPLIPASGERVQLVGNVDIAPTLAEIGGVSPAGMSGVSFASLLAADGAWPREDLLLERRSQNPSGGGTPSNPIPAYLGLVARRSGKLWKYVEIPVGVVNRELYDLTTDPYELVNLAADPAQASLVADLAARLAELVAP